MRISIGCDHGGYHLKESIVKAFKNTDVQLVDRGTFSLESVDYPLYARRVCSDVVNQKRDFGILICTTGIGMSISANKVKGIRAALVHSLDSAILTRQHNDSNIICFGAKYTTMEEALKMIEAFIQEPFQGGRHARRIGLIELEEEQKC